MKRSPDHLSLTLAALCAGLLGNSASQAQEDRAAPRRYLNTVFPRLRAPRRHPLCREPEQPGWQGREADPARLRAQGRHGRQAPTLVVLTPGGGFVQTGATWMDDFGEELARAGYVVAINRYRLSRDINSLKFYDALFKATSDQKAAIRFLLKDAAGPNRFRIDADNIFIGGHSAGSITSMYTAACLDARNKLPDAAVASLQKWGLDGNSGNETIKFKLRGVINLSGAVFDIDMLDAGEPALLHIHGDKDDVVPLGSTLRACMAPPRSTRASRRASRASWKSSPAATTSTRRPQALPLSASR